MFEYREKARCIEPSSSFSFATDASHAAPYSSSPWPTRLSAAKN